MTSEKSEILPNIVTEYENGGVKSQEDKARNRMVAEGYKYHSLNGDKKEELEPIDDGGPKDIFRNKRERKFIYLLAFSIVLITCLTVVLIWQYFATSQYYAGKPCTTPSCVQESAYILNKMQLSTDPCTDFYEYACGKWEKTTHFPPSKSRYGAFSQISDGIKEMLKEILNKTDSNLYKGVSSTAIKKTRDYYSMCMDEEAINDSGIEPVLKHIDELGSWTVTSGDFDRDNWDIHTAMVKSHSFNHAPFFSMAVSPDEKNSSSYIIGFEQAGLTLNDPHEYFLNHSNYNELRKAFIAFVTDFGKLLGGKEAIVYDKVEELYEFEQELAKIHVPQEQLVDPVKTYHKMTVKEFQDNVLGNWLDIEEFLKDMFGKPIPVTENILVYTPAYFKALNKLINASNKQVLANYIVWRSVESLTGYLPAEFLEAALQLDKVESGIKEYPARWKRCLSKIESSLGFALGALYIQENFAESSKTEVESLLEDIRAAFISNLPSVSWMDYQTRDYAIQKAQAVTKMLGYPDFILDPVKLDKYYEKMHLEEELIASKLTISRFYRQKNMRRLRTVPDRTEWDMVPTEVNGYYSPEFNHIVFPAGILQPPLYNPQKPKSFNFGSFGMIVGHELTHGFDNKGRNFDKFGNMHNWWSNASTKAFDEHSKCYEEQYSKFKVQDTHLNGKTTLSENIADNGGLKMAYLAYKSWLKTNKKDSFKLPGLDFTSDQLFFIGMSQLWCAHYTPEYAKIAVLVDVHSIAKFRVLGPMMNSKYFSEAFNCPQNSPMNPEKKCAIW